MPESIVVPTFPVSPELAQKIANTIRFLSADGVQKANSGHPGMPMGCAEIATVLLTKFLRIDPQDSKWINRDRFILSSGHASMLLYSMLYLQGFLSLEDLKQFRQINSLTPGHPEYNHTLGVDATTGPLGAGFAMSVGMTLSERILAEMYNTPKFDIINHYTYVLMGDGCHMEGLTNEAASLAGHLQLNRLIAIYDDNEISIEGRTSIAFTENVNKRYEALGWHVQDIDGHDMSAIEQAILNAQAEKDRPSIIIAHTLIGKGAPHKAGTAGVHGEPLGEEELKLAKEKANWSTEKFYVPTEVADYFEHRRAEWDYIRKQWNELYENYDKKHKSISKELQRVISGELPRSWKNHTPEYPAGKAIASRNSGGEVMNKFGAVIPELIGGSADLAPSNKTEIKTGDYPEFIGPKMYHGRNIHFGVREHAMGSIANGMALHGGIIPYCSTFMVFHDYMRPTLRLAALMNIRTIFVYTHDSIYVGEDGPTHQPVEHLAVIRAMPRVHLWRPADANEVAYAWQAMLDKKDGPSVIALTRQNLETIDRNVYTPAKESLKGMYTVDATDGKEADLLLIASGSEVGLALDVAKKLRTEGRKVRVVSAPCLEAFKEQPEGYRKKVLPRRMKKRVVIEAGIKQGWEGIVGEQGIFIGVEDFGVSGPAQEVAKHFSLTTDQVIEKIKAANL